MNLEYFLPFGNLFSRALRGIKGAYRWGWEVYSGGTSFNTYGEDREKVAMILKNPAVLKVFALQADLFSMGEVCVEQNDKELEEDPFLTLLRKPNLSPASSQSQFLWDFMFWRMMGTAYCYVDSKVVDAQGGNSMYFLDPRKIEWPQELERNKDKFIFSQAQLNKIKKTLITYRYEDGSTFQFPLDKLLISFDLTNGVGNQYKGPSRIDALYKIISNSEYTLDAENVNIRYSGKFIVGSEQSISSSTMRKPMSEEERDDILKKIDDPDRTTYPIRANAKIERFVSDMAALQLPQEYLAQYFLIGNMYGIPRDVLEAYASATYENQEKARAAHVNYTLDPAGNRWMDSFEEYFGYTNEKKNITISWDHLPFMQIFAKEKVDIKQANINALNSLLGMGVSVDNANAYLGTEFVIEPPKEIAADATSPETLAAQAALRGSVGGVQGILAVQASMVTGATEYSSAMAIMTVIYGFTEAQASAVLGPEPTGEQGQQPGSSGEGATGEDEAGAGGQEESPAG